MQQRIRTLLEHYSYIKWIKHELYIFVDTTAIILWKGIRNWDLGKAGSILCNRAFYVNQRSYVMLLRNGSLASSQLTNRALKHFFMNECNSVRSRLIDRSLVKSNVSRNRASKHIHHFFSLPTLRCLKCNESET